MDATVTSNSTIELLNGDNNYFDDSVSYFIIDPKTRKITAPNDFVTLGVESDADSERIWFECPRYVGDNVDLTTRNIYINYENANGEKDSWYSDDVVADGDNVHFSWKIEKKVVRYKGNVKFIVCAMSTDTEGKVLADWNTTLCTASVLEGLEVENPEPPEEEYNLINQLIDVTKNAISEVNSISASSKEEIDELRLQSLADVEAEKTKSIEEVEATKQEALDYIGTGVDKSLSKENLAADAKATGDAFLKLAIKPTAQGSLIPLPDSAEAPIPSMRIFGKTKQATTTGKNKLPNTATTKTVNGVTFTVNKDKSVTVSGTATADDARFDLYNSETGISAGSYIMSGGISVNAYIAILSFNGSSLGINSNVGTDNNLTITEEQTAKGVSIRLMIKAGTTANGTFFPMIRDATITDNTYEPYTGGMPSPNPSYPQALESVGDDGSVEQFVYKKNIIPYPYRFTTQYPDGIINGCTVTENKDKSITVTGTPNQIVYIPVCDFLFNPGTYVMNGCPSGGSATTYNIYAYPNGLHTFDAGNGVTFTVKEKRTTTMYLYINSIGKEVNLTFKPMICLADVNNYDYEPPSTAQSLIIPTPNGLPGIPVSSGGNYTDENGQQYVSDYKDYERMVYVQRVGEYRNTGEAMTCNTVSLASNNSEVVYWNHRIQNTKAGASIRCNCMKNIVDSSEEYCVFTYNTITNYVYFTAPREIIDSYEGSNYKEKVNAWIADTFSEENPLIVLYELETPIETPLSEEEIAAYKALHTNYPNTTIYNDEGAYTEVKYVADTKNYVDNKIANEVAKLTATITT